MQSFEYLRRKLSYPNSNLSILYGTTLNNGKSTRFLYICPRGKYRSNKKSHVICEPVKPPLLQNYIGAGATSSFGWCGTATPPGTTTACLRCRSRRYRTVRRQTKRVNIVAFPSSSNTLSTHSSNFG